MDISKYRKKPVECFAVQWDGTNTEDLLRSGLVDGLITEEENGDYGMVPFIETLNGRVALHLFEYVMVGVAGERYPCDETIFEVTHELVNNTDYSYDGGLREKHASSEI